MIKILHVLSSLNSGGVENMLYNYYLTVDRKKICFEFAVHGVSVGMLEEKFTELGSRVFHVTPKKNSLKRNILEINEIIKRGNYDVVHCHQNFSNFTSLLLAKIHRTPIRISHSHGHNEVISISGMARNSILRYFNKLGANYYFSCSVEAGKWLHGKKWLPSEENIIMKNAIDLHKFSFDSEVRNIYRSKYDIEDRIVLLHVGRFSEEKNHQFMVEIMNNLSIYRNKYILMFVGSGDIEEKIKKCVEKKGLTNNIKFLSTRSDVSGLMNAADIFLFPSKNEGLGISVIEAQAVCLPVLASNKIPIETKVTKLIEYLPIDSAKLWADKIINHQLKPRKSEIAEIQNTGYSIKDQAMIYSAWLEKIK